MKIIPRTFSVLNPNEKLEPLYTIKKFPISMSCVKSIKWNEDVFYDMKWGISSSGHIELMEMVDPNLIYKNYHNPGSVGKIWKDHHSTFYKFISQDRFKEVLEIGGSSGRLVDNFCLHSTKFNWSIIEPSVQAKHTDGRVDLIEGYFENHNFNKKFDTIVHSHVFEHVYDPVVFLRKIYDLLEDDGLHYISIPNMHHWLSHGFTSTLSFEHTFYVDDLVLEHLLSRTGFKVVDKIVDPHSILIKSIKTKNTAIINHNFTYIKKLFDTYIESITKDAAEILTKLGNEKFYLFGGHIFSQALLNLGLNMDNVECIIDNDIQKHYKRLYGTTCLIKPSTVLAEDENPIVVLRGGPYHNEIMKTLLSINPNTRFV